MSFSLDHDEEENDDEDERNSESGSEESWKKRSCEEVEKTNMKKIKKDPNVDTSFLPDREREEEENRLREELRQKWAEQQQKLKEEEIDITFSYWDGSGHRRTVHVKKGKLYTKDFIKLNITGFCSREFNLSVSAKSSGIVEKRILRVEDCYGRPVDVCKRRLDSTSSLYIL